jgi:hypothetical protein
MSDYAIVVNGFVVNLVMWDGGSEWEPPTNAAAVEIPSGTFVDIGYSYTDGTFSAP